MGVTCSAHGIYDKTYRVLFRKPEGTKPFVHLEVGNRIILVMTGVWKVKVKLTLVEQA